MLNNLQSSLLPVRYDWRGQNRPNPYVEVFSAIGWKAILLMTAVFPRFFEQFHRLYDPGNI